MKFEATSETDSAMVLRDELQRFADDFWLPDHVTEEQAAAIVLDAFKRKVAGQLELLGLNASVADTPPRRSRRKR